MISNRRSCKFPFPPQITKTVLDVELDIHVREMGGSLSVEVMLLQNTCTLMEQLETVLNAPKDGYAVL